MTIEHTLGQTIKEARLAKDVTLRKMAIAVEISSTMLSKMERDEAGFRPGEDTIKRIADFLDLDKDYLLSLGDKIDSDLHNMIVQKPQILPQFLRTVGNQSDETLKRIMKEINPNDKE
jgi:transcriptional regulator with XRE-family HTH domain